MRDRFSEHLDLVDSAFLRLVEEHTTRTSARWKATDPLDALSEIFIGIKKAHEDGQELVGPDGILKLIVSRRTSNYFKSQCVWPFRQPVRSLSNDRIGEGAVSKLDSPIQQAMDQELREVIDSMLSTLPTRQAEAIRSRFGFPNTPDCYELARYWGTSVQNVHKHARRGLDNLRRTLPDFDL